MVRGWRIDKIWDKTEVKRGREQNLQLSKIQMGDGNGRVRRGKSIYYEVWGKLKRFWTKGSKIAKKHSMVDSNNSWIKFNKGGMGIRLL